MVPPNYAAFILPAIYPPFAFTPATISFTCKTAHDGHLWQMALNGGAGQLSASFVVN